MSFVLSLFTALANIKAIAGYVEDFAAAVTLWYCQRAQSKTLSMISDAAAMAARAETEDDRYKATDAWHAALSRPRVSK